MNSQKQIAIMIQCAICGRSYPDAARVCTFCGAAQNSEIPTQGFIDASTSIEQSSIASVIANNSNNVPFFSNSGFYGALVIIAGFFLPWIISASGFDLMIDYANRMTDTVDIFLFIATVLPLLASLFVLFNSFTGNFTKYSNLLKGISVISIFALLAIVAFGCIVSTNFLNYLTIGFWMTIAGSMVMLFNKRVRQQMI